MNTATEPETAVDEDTEINTTEVDVPRWIDDDITVGECLAIVQGGCASGAYMPAVTYYQALKTMSEYGNEVFEYLDENMGVLPDVARESWAGMACKYLSCAVEVWASSTLSQLDIED